MDEYIVDHDTLAIKPYKHIKYNAKIFTKYGIYKSTYTPFEIIKESCERYFTSYEARRRATIRYTNFRHKVPIIISKYFNILAFPTNSPSLFHTNWIFVNNIVHIFKIGNYRSEILYNNGTKIPFNISSQNLQRQLTRSYALMHIVGMIKNGIITEIKMPKANKLKSLQVFLD